jgi:hypothetical protein
VKLYEKKDINCGFVVICPNCNIGQVKTTINSIKHNYPSSKFVCVFPDHCHDGDIKEINKWCLAKKGGSTVTSLINVGMKYTPCNEWNFIVIGGSWIRNMLDRKFAYFIESEKDILFPLVDRKMNFIDGSINGILMHKKAFDNIGPFSTGNPLEICKLMWSMDAVEKGYKFKAVLGTTIC